MVESTGGCLCGRVRFRVKAGRTNIAWCHCRLCQRAVGAPVVPWVTVGAQRVAITGEVSWFASSPEAERGHCAVCGTSLFFRAHARPKLLDLTVASFDDPSPLVPEYQIWTASAVPWMDTLRTGPAHADGGPDWSA